MLTKGISRRARRAACLSTVVNVACAGMEAYAMEGKCISLIALSVASDVIDRISDVGLNFRVDTDVVRFKTIFSGFGVCEVNRFARLWIKENF